MTEQQLQLRLNRKGEEVLRSKAIKLFLKFVLKVDGNKVDASRILSVDCYREWLTLKRRPRKNPAEAFRKTITGHVRGDRGLQPFSPEIEASLLKELRNRKVWPCFKGTEQKIGLRGFKSKGFWEKMKKEKKICLDVLATDGSIQWKFAFQRVLANNSISLKKDSFDLTDEEINEMLLLR